MGSGQPPLEIEIMKCHFNVRKIEDNYLFRKMSMGSSNSSEALPCELRLPYEEVLRMRWAKCEI